ncbi:MAG: diaminopimelate epimerase [Cyanobacteria bacterium K_Offshore_surface_m2_239]|nr:diaminopimelate epimerase [Cyanobacteria bacterium K_Offshore_surface_m2_239]
MDVSKYQGLGNDFLLFDLRAGSPGGAGAAEPDLVRRLCDRRFGLGGDGVILALPPESGGDLRMRIFNADGSEAEMCGNGIRCLARFLADRDGEGPGRRWAVETAAGTMRPELEEDGQVRVDMGAPFLIPETVPTTLPTGPAGLPQGELEAGGQRWAVAAAGMGNPHVVVPVAELAALDLEAIGAELEAHPAFPARTNVHLVQVLAPGHLRLRVWERGAGVTLACGTGACATLVACHLLGLSDRQARLDLPGGPLWIAWDETSGHVFMTGPAEPVVHGRLAGPLDQAVEGWLAPESTGGGAQPATAVEAAPAPSSSATAEPIDCATACTQGCQRPDACPSAEARARVAALLEGRSLDDLVQLANDSLESRLLGRRPDGTRLGA